MSSRDLLRPPFTSFTRTASARADGPLREESEGTSGHRSSGRAALKEGEREKEEEREEERAERAEKESINNEFDPSRLYATPSFTVADPATSALARRLVHFTGTLDTRNRRWIRECSVERQGRWSVVKRQLIVLSDRVMIVKRTNKGTFVMKQQAEFDQFYVDSLPKESALRHTRLEKPWRVVFTKPEAGQWILSCPDDRDEVERTAIIKAISLTASRHVFAAAKERNEKLSWGWYLHFVHGTAHLAALENDLETLKEVLSAYPNAINERGQEGRTPLHIAAFRNHSNVIQFLLDRGADIRIRDPNGRTAVHIAAQLGYRQSTQTLLSHSSVEPLLYHTITTSSKTRSHLSNTSAIWMCALSRNGEYEKCLRMLLKHCMKDEYSTITAAHILDVRSDDGMTLLDACVALKLNEVIPILLSLGCTLDVESDDGCTPLGAASQLADMETLTTLIQLGAQVNWRDSVHLNSPLHFAASLEAASYLVANGARPNLKNREGVRVTDVYATTGALSTIRNAEQLFASRAPVEFSGEPTARPCSVEENGGHALENCFVCEESISGLNAIGRKREWCRSCGFAMCGSCLNPNAVFVNPAGEENVVRVCAGCFNRALYAPETKEKRKKRLARQKQAATEAANSIFTLEGLTAMLTAVQVDIGPKRRLETPIPVPQVEKALMIDKNKPAVVNPNSAMQANAGQHERLVQTTKPRTQNLPPGERGAVLSPSSSDEIKTDRSPTRSGAMKVSRSADLLEKPSSQLSSQSVEEQQDEEVSNSKPIVLSRNKARSNR